MAVKSVEEYIQKHPEWKEEIQILRELLLSTELEETITWGSPVYMLNGKNVVSMGAFKNHCALWFFQGGLLKNNTLLLQNAQEGKTQAMRQIRFEKGDEIQPDVLRKYVLEAIQNQKEGKMIKPAPVKKPELPHELKKAFKEDNELKSSFRNLSPGKQREYALYISNAKREVTKENRLEKIKPLIKSGKGLNDKYIR